MATHNNYTHEVNTRTQIFVCLIFVVRLAHKNILTTIIFQGTVCA